MRLLSLTLRNFKGIQEFHLDTGGGDVLISGDNGVGKTTLFDSFCYLLFNKDSANQSSFEIKTLQENGEPYHNLKHEVEAVLEINGLTINLRKVYSEIWSNPKGSIEKVQRGHSTEYFIDGVPSQAKEYRDKIDRIIDENAFRLLTNPRYFNDMMHWQKRRDLLLEICGDISDADVIDSDKQLEPLGAILGKRSIDDHKKVIKARRSEIEDERKNIPVRIDEIKLGLPETDGDISAIEGQIDSFREARAGKQNEINQLRIGGGVAEKQKQIAEIEIELAQTKNKAIEAATARTKDKKTELRGLEEESNQIQSDISKKKAQLDGEDDILHRLNRNTDELRAEWHRLNDKPIVDTCPTCGHYIQADKIADANQSKAERLELIKQDGQDQKGKVDSRQESIDKIQVEIDALRERHKAIVPLIDNCQDQLKEIESLEDDPKETTEYTEAMNRKSDLQREIAEISSDNTHAIGEIEITIASIDDEINKCVGIVAKIKQQETGLARVEKLEINEKTLATEYEQLGKELFLTEEFTRIKVSLSDDKVNSKFKLAKFKLFNTLVNGSIEECCETLYDGVPYSTSLNNGAKINVGLDIVNTLADYYQTDAPIFIDNAESVTDIISTRGQQIKMYVSAGDQELNVKQVRSEALV